ncbi:MAG: response regulator [Puia sp.]
MQRGARSFNLKPLKNESLNLLFDDILTYQSQSPKKLLLIEDNEIESSIIANLLENQGLVEIQIASTGQEGLRLVRENVYDCVIVDYMLPDIPGMEIIIEINEIKKLQITPILIYSAKDFTSRGKNPAEAVRQQNTVKRSELHGSAVRGSCHASAPES